MTTPASWSVAIFTSREDAATLSRTIDALVAASTGVATTIDVLVDNNAATADAIATWAPAALGPGSSIRLWLVTWRDKGCTWNRYVHEIAPDADLAFFVDGYVRPRPDSLRLLADLLDARPDAWAATGVPTVGRSAARLAATMLADGGLHGNLYALRRHVVERFRRGGFRLPLGLYRNDSLIGAVVAFGGDPAHEPWTPSRVAVAADATWDNDVASPWSTAALRGWWRRRLRQAQGDLENAAIRRHLATRGQAPESMPRTVQALLAEPPPVAHLGPVARLLATRAARAVAAGGDWSRCDAPPRLLRTWHGG
jgi:hypothetical protein